MLPIRKIEMLKNDFKQMDYAQLISELDMEFKEGDIILYEDFNDISSVSKYITLYLFPDQNNIDFDEDDGEIEFENDDIVDELFDLIEDGNCLIFVNEKGKKKKINAIHKLEDLLDDMGYNV